MYVRVYETLHVYLIWSALRVLGRMYKVTTAQCERIDLYQFVGGARGVSGGARGVMVIVAGIGHGDTSSNPGLIAFHIALIPFGKVWIQLFSLQLSSSALVRQLV